MNAVLATSTLRKPRTANPAAVQSRSPMNRQSRPNQRAILLGAFREIGAAVDSKTAGTRTEDWYRSSGADWARGLG